tara:strand:+ start:376 stop:1005 length:630 start_codon:yes stop_codon:yes gene_type:complete
MAFDKRTYPNKYFAWYNDDNRLAIVTEDTTSTSGERTTEKYDTFQGSGSSGSISAFSKDGTTITATSPNHGLSDNASSKDTITIVSSAGNYSASEEITKLTKDTFTFQSSNTGASEETGTWTASNVVDGLRITFHSKYEEVTAISHDLYSNAGLDSGLHNALLCYVKSRMYEDMGNIQQAQYFYQMYDNKVKKFKSRRSGLRFLSVPKI